MKAEKFLDEIDQELFDIHSLLFGGNITSEDLKEIKETLNEYFNMLKRIKEYNEEVYKIMDQIIKWIRIFFHTCSLLVICFIILNFLSIPVGIGLFIFLNYLSYTFKNEYQKSKEDDKLSQNLTRLIEDVKYKQVITNKKMKRLEKISKLQIESSRRVEAQTINNLQIEKAQIRELKLENRQV